MKVLASRAYRHSSLSINERTHRTINDMFAKFSLEWGSMKNWASWWPQIQGSITHSITDLEILTNVEIASKLALVRTQQQQQKHLNTHKQ
eukprot:Awhi_evm1s4636